MGQAKGEIKNKVKGEAKGQGEGEAKYNEFDELQQLQEYKVKVADLDEEGSSFLVA